MSETLKSLFEYSGVAVDFLGHLLVIVVLGVVLFPLAGLGWLLKKAGYRVV